MDGWIDGWMDFVIIYIIRSVYEYIMIYWCIVFLFVCFDSLRPSI